MGVVGVTRHIFSVSQMSVCLYLRPFWDKKLSMKFGMYAEVSE